MALIICSECGTNVSEKASACPKCGCPIEITIEKNHNSKRMRIKRIVIILTLLIVTALLSIGIYKFIKRPDKSGYYNGLKWGMTYDEVQNQLGENTLNNPANKDVIVNYEDYEGKKNIDALASFDCTDDSLNKITLFITNGADSSYTNESLIDEFVYQLDELYGKHDTKKVTYKWRTKKSDVELSYLPDGLIVVSYQDITKTRE